MKSIILSVMGSFVSIFVMIKCLFIMTVRLSGVHGSVLLQIVNKTGKSFIVNKEITDRSLPRVYTAYAWIGFFVHIDIAERMLRAGYEGFDTPITVTIFRWNLERLEQLLNKNLKKPDSLPVYILKPWDAEQIGDIRLVENNPLYMDDGVRKDIEIAFDKFMSSEEDNKSFGVILYGPPGTGKSHFVRYLAIKHKLPIYFVSFTADTDNHQLIRMFAHIAGPAIVLFEDFDSYFNGKKCLLLEARFTFDTLLNVFDGVFSSKGDFVRVVTANDIEKVDASLKMRPSRFRFVKKMGCPTLKVREEMFGDSDLVKRTEGLNLDQLLAVKQAMDEGIPLEDAVLFK